MTGPPPNARARLLAQGPAALSRAELIAMLLGSGARGASAIDLGRRLLTEAGGLPALLAESAPALRGLGPTKRARLVTALERARRSLGEQLRKRPALSSPQNSPASHHAQLRD